MKADTRNITLALSRDLLRRVKMLAAEQGVSVSGLVTALLESRIRQEDEYWTSWESMKAALDRGYDLGTHGRSGVTRDQLHER